MPVQFSNYRAYIVYLFQIYSRILLIRSPPHAVYRIQLVVWECVLHIAIVREIKHLLHVFDPLHPLILREVSILLFEQPRLVLHPVLFALREDEGGEVDETPEQGKHAPYG